MLYRRGVKYGSRGAAISEKRYHLIGGRSQLIGGEAEGLDGWDPLISLYQLYGVISLTCDDDSTRARYDQITSD